VNPTPQSNFLRPFFHVLLRQLRNGFFFVLIHSGGPPPSPNFMPLYYHLVGCQSLSSFGCRYRVFSGAVPFVFLQYAFCVLAYALIIFLLFSAFVVPFPFSDGGPKR